MANEKFTLKARKDYWQQGSDGQPLPYVDQVVCVDVKAQSPAYVAGLVSDQFDIALGMDYSAYRTLQEQHPDIVLSKVRSSGTLLFRAHADAKPFDDAGWESGCVTRQSDAPRLIDISFTRFGCRNCARSA